MKTLLTFGSGASVEVTVADLELAFPNRVAPVAAIDGTILALGQSVTLLPGLVLSTAPDDPATEASVPAV